jgi:hypothetical protein
MMSLAHYLPSTTLCIKADTPATKAAASEHMMLLTTAFWGLDKRLNI